LTAEAADSQAKASDLCQRSERSTRLIEQLALALEELEADATEDELGAEEAVAKTTTVRQFTRKRAERQTFPEHLPRERVVIDGPTACECCGSNAAERGLPGIALPFVPHDACPGQYVGRPEDETEVAIGKKWQRRGTS